MWLVKLLKRLVSENRSTVNILNSLKNCTIALPWYCFITLVKFEMDNACLSVSGILGVYADTLTAHGKYSLRNTDNLPEPIQLQLSKKKIFSEFLAPYLKSKSNIENFE